MTRVEEILSAIKTGAVSMIKPQSRLESDLLAVLTNDESLLVKPPLSPVEALVSALYGNVGSGSGGGTSEASYKTVPNAFYANAGSIISVSKTETDGATTYVLIEEGD